MKRIVPLIGVLAGACAGPAIETARVPPVSPAAAWRSDAGPVTPVEHDWWRAFGDPQLGALVERALANNPDLGVAAARVREARAQERAAHAQLLPTLDASAGGARSRSVNAFGTPVEQTAGQPQFVASYEIDLFGRLGDQVAAARAGVQASEAARGAVRLGIASAVASGYIVLRALDARLEITRETLAARADAMRIARSRAAQGYSPMLEQRQAEAEYEATAQLVPQLQLAIARQEDALSQLTGDPPHAIPRGMPLASLTAPGVPEGLPSDLLRRRPDIAQAEYQLAATDAALAAARKRFLPQIKLSGAAGAAISTLLSDPITIWSIGGSILAPLFQGGRIEAQAEGAAAQRDSAAFAYRRVALTAFREVEDNLAATRYLSLQLDRLRAQRTALADGLRLATNRYRAGYSSYLEQLDAQRGLLASELALIQTQADALTARVALYQAMGGGWSREDAVADRQPTP